MLDFFAEKSREEEQQQHLEEQQQQQEEQHQQRAPLDFRGATAAAAAGTRYSA
jgi:hypothetical protein